MTPEELATLQARAYRHMSPWSVQSFRDLFEQKTTRLETASGGFLMARCVLDEAEILALATDPDHQRQGIATGLWQRFANSAQARGITTVFLDVAASNAPAIAFYASHGFQTTGRRKGYYTNPDGTRDDALLMRRILT